MKTNAATYRERGDLSRTNSHVALPMGKQELSLPCGTSRNFLGAGGYRHFVVLWFSKMHHPSTLWTVPSRTTLQTRWETHLSAMSEVCRRRATQTVDQAFPHLQTHRQGALFDWYLVYSRIKGSHQTRLHCPARS